MITLSPIHTLDMGIKALIVFLFLPGMAFAQTPSIKDAIDLLDEAQQQIKALSGPELSCFTASPTELPASSKLNQSKVCTDLFGASCLGPDGKSKHEGRSESLTEELRKPLREARDKTAKLMGYKDFDDALKARLKEAGLDVIEPLDTDAWKNLKREGEFFSSGGDGPKKLYSTVDQCTKESEELREVQYSNLSDIGQLTATAKKFDGFQAKYKEQSVGLYARDISNFFNEQISTKCSLLKRSASFYKPDQNPEAVIACGNLSNLKRQAAGIFRIEGTPEYKEQAEKFVRENILPELKYSSETIPSSSAASPTSKKTDAEKLKNRIKAASDSVRDYCYSYSSLVGNAGNKVFGDLASEVNKSKPTVDAVLDSFYSDSKKKMATQTFDRARSDIQSIASQFVKDPAKRTEILNGYNDLKLFWLEKPATSLYSKNGKGMMVLDGTKTPPSFIDDDVYGVFSDPSLSFFTTINANYMPPVSMGKFSYAERVNMMPAFIHLSETNPYAFLSVIAHEVGHKIGPEVSKTNGYDLAPEYSDLLACYKDSKSINLQNGQQDETIADYISSEVLARQIAKLPVEERQPALMASMEDFCIFDDESSTVNFSSTHPENLLRVGGIYGANPNLRVAVGCDAESPEFKTCGLSEVKPASQSKAAQ